MIATRKKINKWVKTAKENDIKFIISVCDTFEFDDYPVYCKEMKELKEKFIDYDGVNMQQVNEIINIKEDGSVEENLMIVDNKLEKIHRFFK